MPTYNEKAETVDKDETLKVVEKTFTPPDVTVDLDMSKLINQMEGDKKDIESIVGRFNQRVADYNEALVALSSATKALTDVTASFPVIPTIVKEE